MRKIILTGVILINILTLSLLMLIVYYNNILPDNYYVTVGSEFKVSGFFETVSCSGYSANVSKDKTNSSEKSQTHQAQLKFLGIIPIKTVNVQEVDEPLLVPCGEPFGIKMLTDGVMVVEVSSFQTNKGFVSPASEAGIKTGDIIKKVNGEKVMSNTDIEGIISKSGGEAISVCLIRDNKEIITNVKPKKCSRDDSYRAGMWVRDSSAGIGTITFYSPDTGIFAGLGHPVCDTDTGKIIPLSSGEVCGVYINGVKKGRSGSPGELIGMFVSDNPIGFLLNNCQEGIYGEMTNFNPFNQAIPLGMRQDIKIGEAYIYSTVKGNTPVKYKIEIEKIDLNDSEESKNMIIRVVDKDLLDTSGGIVQGMSGSPIIQNGKLIGAVTHVFLNNPAKGYAIFADSMYNEALNNQSDLLSYGIAS